MTFGGKVCLFKLQKGSKIDLLSKICIFSENIQKTKIFKKSKKNLVVSKMEQNSFTCSIGIWNYHLTPSKSVSRIFLWPYASPLWPCYILQGVATKFILATSHVYDAEQLWPRSIILKKWCKIVFPIYLQDLMRLYPGGNQIIKVYKHDPD